MKNEIPYLTPELRELAEMYFIMLKSESRAKKRDTLQLNLSGYADVMYLIADITKVCMMALEYETSCTRIPEPMVNISGVLGIILDLIPYEEADLLDKIREAVLLPEMAEPVEEDYILENLFLTLPTSFQN
jgi:hypothetical protein